MNTTAGFLGYESLPVLRCATCAEDRPHVLSFRSGPITHYRCLACGMEVVA